MLESTLSERALAQFKSLVHVRSDNGSSPVVTVKSIETADASPFDIGPPEFRVGNARLERRLQKGMVRFTVLAYVSWLRDSASKLGLFLNLRSL